MLKKKIMLLFLCLIFLTSSNLQNPTDQPKSSIINYNQAGFESITFFHTRGNSLIKWNIYGFVMAGSGGGDNGSANVFIQYFEPTYTNTIVTTDATYINEQTSLYVSQYQESYPTWGVTPAGTNIDYFSIAYYSNFYFLNHSINPVESKTSATFTVTKDTAECYFTDTTTTIGLLVYHLEPTIILNSTYYNYDNVRCYVNNFYYSAEDYLFDEPEIEYIWKEQSIDNIILNYPYYRLRLVDKTTNEIVYEDSELQLFTTYRTIDIDAIRVQNNADEPIITELLQNQGHFKGFDSFDSTAINQPPNWYIENYGTAKTTVASNYQSHYNVMNMSDTAGFNNYTLARTSFTAFNAGNVEFYFNPLASNAFFFSFMNTTYQTVTSGYLYHAAGFCINNITGSYYFTNSPINAWTHIRFSFNATDRTVSVYRNSILTTTITYQNLHNTDVKTIQFYTWNAGAGSLLIDALDVSSTDEYYLNRNCELNNSAAIYNVIANSNIAANLTLQTNPYASSLSNFTQANYIYRIADLYNNTLEISSLNSTQNQITYTPPNMRDNFISLANQRNQYLNFENYQIRINNSLIYSNIFYAEIDAISNISIYTRENKYLTSVLHTTTRDSNFIAITLTQFKLKIFNQQEKFAFVNLTYDPNYFSSSQYWSEWIAPNEIIEFYLSPDHYKLNITEYESNILGTSVVYSYDLFGDEILLITSSYTLLNAITNILNVNTTIGNQITNVAINLTNQNSDINYSIVNLDININNMNSSFGDMLINNQLSLNAIQNNITTLYIYQNGNFTQISNDINTSFTELNNSIFLTNNSIYTGVQIIEANLVNMENNITGTFTQQLALNPELTAILVKTYFSEYLNWSTNATELRNQIDTYNFVNNFRNESLMLQLEYQNKIQNMSIERTPLNLDILNQGVKYRVTFANGTELNDWEDLSEKKIEFGNYTEILPATPADLNAEYNDWILVVSVLISIAIASVIVVLLVMQRQSKNKRRIEILDTSTRTYRPSDFGKGGLN
jgi:hypothetical protein